MRLEEGQIPGKSQRLIGNSMAEDFQDSHGGYLWLVTFHSSHSPGNKQVKLGSVQVFRRLPRSQTSLSSVLVKDPQIFPEPLQWMTEQLSAVRMNHRIATRPNGEAHGNQKCGEKRPLREGTRASISSCFIKEMEKHLKPILTGSEEVMAAGRQDWVSMKKHTCHITKAKEGNGSHE